MMATRPSSEGAGAQSTAQRAVSGAQEEKNIPGVNTDALKDERRPLLDLDDVDQLESELAACFDAPPPPPLSIRREEPAATISSWTAASEQRHVEHRYVAPPTTSTRLVEPEVGEGQEQQQQQQQLGRQGARDFSSLYSPSPHRAMSSGQLYPACVPTAPSTETMRASPVATMAAGRGATSGSVGVATAVAGKAAAAASGDVVERAKAIAGKEQSGVVVDELLTENERLRLIIQDMSEELEKVSLQLAQQSGEGGTAVAGGAAQSRALAVRPAGSAASQMMQYPGAEAEARRRQREQGQQQQQQQQQQPRQELRRGIFVHFKCENCPQWLKVPGHAQLVYCPTCNHTSQMTERSTMHFPPNTDSGASSSNNATNAPAPAPEENEGWFGYIKSVLAS